MFKYCSVWEPVSLSAKCNDTDLTPSLSLCESSGIRFRHSFAKWSYSLHLKTLYPISFHTGSWSWSRTGWWPNSPFSFSWPRLSPCPSIFPISTCNIIISTSKNYLSKDYLSENHLYLFHILYYLQYGFY